MNNIMIKKIDYNDISDEIKLHPEIKKNLITFSEQTTYFGAYIFDRLVGCCGYKEFSKTIWLKSSFVLPEYRLIGIYSRLSKERMSLVILKNKKIYAFATKNSIHYHLKSGAKIIKSYKALSHKITY